MNELSAYDFELPRELIAQHPLPVRSDARLLIVDRKRATLTHEHVRNLPEILKPSDVLVLNDSQVLPARLVGHRARTGGRWQGLYLRSHAAGAWEVIGTTRGKLQPGETVCLHDMNGHPACDLLMRSHLGEGHWVAVPDSSQSALQILQHVGRIPLPPYIRGGEMKPTDRERYQTVYAVRPGSVAAPTAGLHFTQPLLARLSEKGIARQTITLHVGPGTFRPISASSLGQHPMHSEWGQLTPDVARALAAARARHDRVIAVGTTTVRVLETAAAGGRIAAWSGQTELFIRPPFEFHAIDGLLTNFHLPRSTLLVLVMTFGGQELIRRAYQAAIEEGYRFYSYGDAMLII